MERRRVDRARLGAEAEPQPVVAVLAGSGRRGQDVLDRPADVGEVRGPVTAYVVEEAGGGEAAAQGESGAGGEGGGPAGDGGVAVEHRHAQVVDVVLRDRELFGEAVTGRREAPLGADRRLGGAC
ncbi:hypothetical protein IQ63_05165 [Streptomyces acidiscabies]|uniref:Uncharacterized protein n=1 Tax=Streptomyces acidiscabies TaxID=42234 RepID=A0A0L0KMM1_9ACTN|nr:hypothetical protein IQ63_05165 [Streptomyces acidiscabies]